jgi:hypothetical protein
MSLFATIELLKVVVDASTGHMQLTGPQVRAHIRTRNTPTSLKECKGVVDDACGDDGGPKAKGTCGGHLAIVNGAAQVRGRGVVERILEDAVDGACTSKPTKEHVHNQ